MEASGPGGVVLVCHLVAGLSCSNDGGKDGGG